MQESLEVAPHNPSIHYIKVHNSGHWIPEERPDFVIKLLGNFFGGSTTKTLK
ncbi:MAG TPA: hypothetical protein VFI70_04315 [Nitrososphaeraceae archaeon]|nr:hypothetical protein [Nitrososphaeraceae archaeon]